MRIALAVVMASIAALASPASATTVTTPPIFLSFSGSQALRCLYTNLETNKDVAATRYLVDAVGDRVYQAEVTIPSQSTVATLHSLTGAARCGLDGKFRRGRIAITACALSGDATVACVSTSP